MTSKPNIVIFFILSIFFATSLSAMDEDPSRSAVQSPPPPEDDSGTLLLVPPGSTLPPLPLRRRTAFSGAGLHTPGTARRVLLSPSPLSGASSSAPVTLSAPRISCIAHEETCRCLQAFLDKLGVEQNYFDHVILPDLDGRPIRLDALDTLFKRHVQDAFLDGRMQLFHGKLHYQDCVGSIQPSAPSAPLVALPSHHMPPSRLGTVMITPLRDRTMGVKKLPCITPSRHVIDSLPFSELLKRFVGHLLLAPVGSIDTKLRELASLLFAIDPVSFQISAKIDDYDHDRFFDRLTRINRALNNEVALPLEPLGDETIDAWLHGVQQGGSADDTALGVMARDVLSYYCYKALGTCDRVTSTFPHGKNDFLAAIETCDLITWLHFEPGEMGRLAAHVRHLIFAIHCYRSALPDAFLSRQTDIFYRDAIRLYKTIETYIEAALGEFTLSSTSGTRRDFLRVVLTEAYARVCDFRDVMGINGKTSVAELTCISFAYKKLLILAKAIEVALGLSNNLPIQNFTFLKDAHGHQVTVEKGSNSKASGGHFMLSHLDVMPCPVYNAIDLCELPETMEALSNMCLTVRDFHPCYVASSGVVLGDWLIYDAAARKLQESKLSGLFPDCYRDSYVKYVALLNRAIRDHDFARSHGITLYKKTVRLEDDEPGVLMACRHVTHDVYVIKHPHCLGCASGHSCPHNDTWMHVMLYYHDDEYTVRGCTPFSVTTINSVFPLVVFDEHEACDSSFSLRFDENTHECNMDRLTRDIEMLTPLISPSAQKWREARDAVDEHCKARFCALRERILSFLATAHHEWASVPARTEKELTAGQKRYERTVRLFEAIETMPNRKLPEFIEKLSGYLRDLQVLTSPTAGACNDFLREIEEIAMKRTVKMQQIDEAISKTTQDLEATRKCKEELRCAVPNYQPRVIAGAEVQEALRTTRAPDCCYRCVTGGGGCQLVDIAPHMLVKCLVDGACEPSRAPSWYERIQTLGTRFDHALDCAEQQGFGRMASLQVQLGLLRMSSYLQGRRLKRQGQRLEEERRQAECRLIELEREHMFMRINALRKRLGLPVLK